MNPENPSTPEDVEKDKKPRVVVLFDMPRGSSFGWRSKKLKEQERRKKLKEREAQKKYPPKR